MLFEPCVKILGYDFVLYPEVDMGKDIMDYGIGIEDYDIKDYEGDAHKRAKEHTGGVVCNDDFSHARVLADKMMSYAGVQDVISIYSGKLPENVYGKPINSTEAKLIRILVDDTSGLAWVKHLEANVKNKIELYKASDQTLRHFFSVGTCYRLELKDIDKTNACKAIGDFNDPDATKCLNEIFEKKIKDAEEVDLEDSRTECQ